MHDNNETVSLFIIIEAVGVEQGHGGSSCFAVTYLDILASEAEKPAESNRRREERKEGKKLQEREEVKLETSIVWILMHNGGRGGEMSSVHHGKSPGSLSL